jgi:hypothetical protein
VKQPPKFSPIKPSNIVVLFPPGSGGNFLIKLLAENFIFGLASKFNPAVVLDQSKLPNLQLNEFSSDYFPIITGRHLHQFFSLSNPRTGTLHSLNRYREILSHYRYSKFIIVHTTVEQRIYCNVLNVLKSKANWPDKFGERTQMKMQQALEYIHNGYLTDRKYDQRRPYHYAEFSRRLKQQGTPVLDVNYQDLFLMPDYKLYQQLMWFVTGGFGRDDELTVRATVKQARAYHDNNQNLISSAAELLTLD